MLKSLLRKIAGLNEKVKKGAGYDKKNIADEVRGPKANDAMLSTKKQLDKVLRFEVGSNLDVDLNKQASLKIGALNFLAKAKNIFGNLITISIIKDAQLIAAVNEEQLISFDEVPDAGLWSLSYGSESTSNLAFNANASAVQSALRLIEGLEDVTVTGNYSSGFTVVFEGSAGGQDQPMLQEDTNTLEESASPVSIIITEEEGGVAASDTREVIVIDNHIEVHCISAATNAEVKAQIEASSSASELISIAIDSGQGAVSATAAVSAELTGGA
jgi:hypothetical protein